MKYTIPKNIKLLSEPFIGKKTRLAIECAAEWLDENPDFQPSFTKIANVILNSNHETAEMTKEVYKFCRVDEQKESEATTALFLGEVDFATYAIAVAAIHAKGWDAYIDYLASKDKKDATET